jgi:hypothetical protein
MKHKHRLIWASIIAITLLVVGPLSGVGSAVQNGGLAQGFQFDDSQGAVASGALVSLKPNSSSVVQLASTGNISTLFGVTDSKALLTFSQDSQQVHVVVSGSTTALVSDINGLVRNGDKITASPIPGVGMKTTESGQIVGTATSTAKGGEQVSIKDKQGKRHDVHLTSVGLQVNVGRYDAPSSGLLPTAVQNIANDIAGHNVSVIRVLIALIMLLIGLASVLIIVFVSIRASITAIGRNPMASPDIRRGLHEILLISFIVSIATMILSFFALRL